MGGATSVLLTADPSAWGGLQPGLWRGGPLSQKHPNPVSKEKMALSAFEDVPA